MTNGNGRDLHLRRAVRALASAKLLLKDGDTDGASSRAYYAMFDAALAALSKNSGGKLPNPKTHGGLISAFSEAVVKNGPVAAERGREFNQVHQLRLVADYVGEPVSPENAAWAIGRAERFVEDIEQYLSL